MYYCIIEHTLFPVYPLTLGHWPWPQVMSSLSNGHGSNMQNTPYKNSLWFRDLLSRLFDKINMTGGRGRWPRDSRKLEDFYVQDIQRRFGRNVTNLKLEHNHTQLHHVK